jgi:zinc transport system substrate-binding protein
VDDAIAAREPEHALDVLDAADLIEAGEHSHDDHGHDEELDEGLEGLDPHFWLDPMRLAAVGHEIAQVLAAAAPDHAETFAAGADELEADMVALDQEFRTGLAECERDVVITGHAAFGYLAGNYGFGEIGIAGIDPETEPSPARLREIGEVVQEYGVTRIFAEDPVNPAVAATLADALGIEVGLLDPIETQAEPDADYRDVMESNLTELRAGLGCG